MFPSLRKLNNGPNVLYFFIEKQRFQAFPASLNKGAEDTLVAFRGAPHAVRIVTGGSSALSESSNHTCGISSHCHRISFKKLRPGRRQGWRYLAPAADRFTNPAGAHKNRGSGLPRFKQ